jgi:hypothetical protein
VLYPNVDGPLNPYDAGPHRLAGHTTHRMKPDAWIARPPGKHRAYVRPPRVWLSPAHGPRLPALGELYDLVRATARGADANTCIAPVLGLPDPPVVDRPGPPGIGPDGTCRKTRHLVAHAGGRPFAWADDDLDDLDRDRVRAHHDGPALLRHVDPRPGLTDADFTALAAFARTLRSSVSSASSPPNGPNGPTSPGRDAPSRDAPPFLR